MIVLKFMAKKSRFLYSLIEAGAEQTTLEILHSIIWAHALIAINRPYVTDPFV